MRIAEEKIRELQRKIPVTYEEAEKALQKYKGNIDDAYWYLKNREGRSRRGMGGAIERLINAVFAYRILIYRDIEEKETFLNLPILVFVLVYFFIGQDLFLVLMVLTILLVVVANCKVRIEDTGSHRGFSFSRTIHKNDVQRSKSKEQEESKEKARQVKKTTKKEEKERVEEYNQREWKQNELYEREVRERELQQKELQQKEVQQKEVQQKDISRKEEENRQQSIDKENTIQPVKQVEETTYELEKRELEKRKIQEKKEQYEEFTFEDEDFEEFTIDK